MNKESSINNYSGDADMFDSRVSSPEILIVSTNDKVTIKCTK